MPSDTSRPTQNALKGILESAEVEKAAPKKQEGDRMELPAPYVDEVYFTYWKGHIRFSFGEIGKIKDVYWRAAVTMEARDARDLVKRLTNLLDRMELADPGSTGLEPGTE